jgi:ABC-type Fe3+-hydroxamate transport system substrate-binding protein
MLICTVTNCMEVFLCAYSTVYLNMFITDLATYTASPQRIISVVPSITELLHYFKLDEETIGITKFCVHPHEWFKSKTKIGGTKNINIEKVIALNPDLIICAKEENTKEEIDALAEKFPVYKTDVRTYNDALEMIKAIGVLTNKTEAALVLIKEIDSSFKNHIAKVSKKLTGIYVIWKNPYMTVGAGTFIHDLMDMIGIENIFKNETRYPIFTIEDIKNLQPDIILLSSEPYPFTENHIEEMKQLFPEAKIMLADGEMFSWYGSRMLLMPKYFAALQNAIF